MPQYKTLEDTIGGTPLVRLQRLGAAVGLLVAPQPGSETRRALRERVQRGIEETNDLEETV